MPSFSAICRMLAPNSLYSITCARRCFAVIRFGDCGLFGWIFAFAVTPATTGCPVPLGSGCAPELVVAAVVAAVVGLAVEEVAAAATAGSVAVDVAGVWQVHTHPPVQRSCLPALHTGEILPGFLPVSVFALRLMELLTGYVVQKETFAAMDATRRGDKSEMRLPSPPDLPEGGTPAERLDLAFRKVLTVPKTALLKEEEKQKQAREKKRAAKNAAVDAAMIRIVLAGYRIICSRFINFISEGGE